MTTVMTRSPTILGTRGGCAGHGTTNGSKIRGVALRDGSEVLIRPIQTTDAQLLADGFTRLSVNSRQQRFLMAKANLSPAELRYLTEIDHHDHEALAALNCADGRGVGVARYVRDVHNPHAAEVAVTVIDEWQGRGLGTELMNALSARALEEGVGRFTALIAADNLAVVGLLRKANADVELVSHEYGTSQYEIALARDEIHGVLADLTRPTGNLFG